MLRIIERHWKIFMLMVFVSAVVLLPINWTGPRLVIATIIWMLIPAVVHVWKFQMILELNELGYKVRRNEIMEIWSTDNGKTGDASDCLIDCLHSARFRSRLQEEACVEGLYKPGSFSS